MTLARDAPMMLPRRSDFMAAIRVILADDHAVVRKGIREFLEEENDICVLA